MSERDITQTRPPHAPIVVPVVTSESAPEVLRISRDRFRRLVRDLDVPHVAHGKLLVVTVDDFVAALRRHARAANETTLTKAEALRHLRAAAGGRR